MREDPFDRWAREELRRLEREERREEAKKAFEERKRIREDRYLDAPVMGLDGKIIKK